MAVTDNDAEQTLTQLQTACTAIDNVAATDSANRAAALRKQISNLENILHTNQAALTYLQVDHDSTNKLAEARALSKKQEETLEQLMQKKQQMQEEIARLSGAIGLASSSISEQKKQINLGLNQTRNFDKLLQERMVVAATRDRMLQLSQERNIYKKKIIYILLSIVIALIVAIIASYNFFSKK